MVAWVGEQAPPHSAPGPRLQCLGTEQEVSWCHPLLSGRLDMARVGEMVQEVVVVQGAGLASASVHARCRRCQPSWVCPVLRDKVFTERAQPNATKLGTAQSWQRSERVMVSRARTRLRRGKAVTALDPRAAWELKRSSFSASFIPSAAGDGYFPAEAGSCRGQPRVPASGRWLPWKDSRIAFESAAGQPVLPAVCLSLTPRGWTRWPR